MNTSRTLPSSPSFRDDTIRLKRYRLPILLEWLDEFNDRMGREGVPHVGRPMRAWFEWCRETGESLEIADPEAKQIFDWFETRSPAGSLFIRPIFTGAFYFDARFWTVTIPKSYGAGVLNASDALEDMPPTIKQKLFSSAEDVENFKALWADCLDYGLGAASLNQWGSVIHFWQRLIVSGDRKLRSAVGDLCSENPGENAIQSSREACEMFLKAFLARDYGLSEEDARNPRKFGHHLPNLVDKILDVAPTPIFREVKVRLNCFPNVEDRYGGKPYSRTELWDAYKVAQAVAAEVIRVFTKLNNTRAQMATRF
jgi:hypothetical protein